MPVAAKKPSSREIPSTYGTINGVGTSSVARSSSDGDQSKRSSNMNLVFGVIMLLISVPLLIGVIELLNSIQYYSAYYQGQKNITTVMQKELLSDGLDSEEIFYTNFYFFNVTNTNEVQNGQKPILAQIGPYAYREYRSKVILFEDNAKIKYKPKSIWKFCEELSSGNESDNITLPNIPLISLAAMLSNSSFSKFSIFPNVEKILIGKGVKLFTTARVKEWLLDGISIKNYLSLPIPEMEKIKAQIPSRFKEGHFGFLHKLNETQDVWSVSTTNGELQESTNKFAHIFTWNSLTSMGTWNDDECDQIKGTDGTIFPLLPDKLSTLFVFHPKLCRSFKLTQHSSINLGGVSARVFTFAPETFANITNLSQNYCYCKEFLPICSKGGVLPMGKCFGGSPIFLSLPHFKKANPDFIHGVVGLNPNDNETDYDTYFYVDKVFGSFLGSKVRLQLNIELMAYESTSLFPKLKNVMFPLLWIEQVQKSKEENIKELLQSWKSLFG